LHEKEAEIAEKRSDLIALQSALIKAVQNPKSQNLPNPESLKAIPIVMSRVQNFVYHLSEGAIDQGILTVPINAVLGVTDAIGKLYDVLVDTGKLQETPEQKNERIAKYTERRQEVIAVLQRAVAQAKARKAAAAEPDPPTGGSS
jgi:hypothetical protein